MAFIDIPTEQTTAVTDAITAGMAMGAAAYLHRIGRHNRWKTTLWVVIFTLMALAAALGAIAHGFKTPQMFQTLIWYPLYLSLGLLVALFIVGVVYDMWGEVIARRVLPIMVVIGLGFWGLSFIWPDNFRVFIAYETIAMLFALGGYTWLACKNNFPGAYLIAIGIVVTIIAAGVQAGNSLSFTCIWSFDHNGLYHLLQMVGIVFIVAGLRETLRSRVITT